MKRGAKGKYSKSIVEKICTLRASGEHTNEAICVSVGICEDTFYKWLREKPEFTESFKKAEIKATKNLAQIARSSLVKKIEGYDYEETHQEGVRGNDGSITITHVKRIKKHVPPSDTAIIFALKNSDPENFSEKVVNEHTGEIGVKKRFFDE